MKLLFNDPDARFAKRHALVALLALNAFVLFYFIIATADGVPSFDWYWTGTMHKSERALLTTLALIFTALGDVKWMAVLTLITAIIAYRYKAWDGLAMILLTSSGFVASNIVAKWLIDRPRPPFEAERIVDVFGSSFPSGHAMGSVAMYGLFAWLAYRLLAPSAKRTILILVLALLPVGVAWSRTYLLAHYATDVLAGASLSIAVIAVATGITRYYVYKKTPRLRYGSYRPDTYKTQSAE